MDIPITQEPPSASKNGKNQSGLEASWLEQTCITATVQIVLHDYNTVNTLLYFSNAAVILRM